ncbi:MAG: TnpV protein [Roseburia sp.]|nr:TnpV protein [Roseburia sp.]
MSSEICIFERMGGTYTEVDGILYPNVGVGVRELIEAVDVENVDVGKYGHLWISYMKENHKDRYRHYVRMRQLCSKANEVNEEAYEMVERMINQYLKKYVLKDSHFTVEMWRIREQAKATAEEMVYEAIVYRYR